MIFPNPFRFLRSMWAVFRLWLKGERIIVPEEVMEERMGKCLVGCPHLDPKSSQCKLCTCFVALKTVFANEKCPVGRWKKWKSYLYFSNNRNTTLKT